MATTEEKALDVYHCAVSMNAYVARLEELLFTARISHPPSFDVEIVCISRCAVGVSDGADVADDDPPHIKWWDAGCEMWYTWEEMRLEERITAFPHIQSLAAEVVKFLATNYDRAMNVAVVAPESVADLLANIIKVNDTPAPAGGGEET